jgi:methyltransferase-like protein
MLQQEQYIDFLTARRFRRTLLCHDDLKINRSIEPEAMMQFHFSLARPLEPVEVDIRNERPVQFKSAANTLTAANRLTKAAMAYLKEVFPGYVSFQDLYRTALDRIERSPDEAAGQSQSGPLVLAADLLLGYSIDLLAICLHPPVCVVPLSPRPLVNPLARLQAKRSKPITSQRHQPVVLHPVAQQIVRRLDGSHSRRELVQSVQEAFRTASELAVRQGVPLVPMPEPHLLPEIVDRMLAQISTAGLLIG